MYDKVLLRITILNVCWQLQVHHLAHQAAVASAHCPSVLGAFTLVPEQQQQQASVSSEVIKQASNKSPVALRLSAAGHVFGCCATSTASCTGTLHI